MIGALYRNEVRSRILALIAAVFLCASAGFGIYYTRSHELSGRGYQSILSEVFQGFSTVLIALVGLGLGFAQVYKEHTPGMQAFLLHRPLSRTRIFYGKLAAALTLYLLIVVPPVAMAIIYSATTRTAFGPWLWQMAIPSIMDVICGTTYVVVGMLIVSRQARWFGSRILPLGPAVFASICTYAPWFWVGPTFIAVAWLVLLPPAWSSFVNLGRESRERWPARLGVVVSLMPALLSLPPLLANMAAELILPDRRYDPQPYRQLLGADLYESLGQKVRPLIDEKGKLIAEGVYAARTDTAGSSGLVVFDSSRPMNYTRHYRLPDTYFYASYGSSVDGQSREYYVYDWNRIAIYRREGVQAPYLAGYLGDNGQFDTLEKATPFSPRDPMQIRYNGIRPLVERTRVIWPDSRGSIVLFEAPAGEQTMGASMFQDVVGSPMRLLVATDKAAYIVDTRSIDRLEHRVLVRLPHPAGDYSQVQVGASADGSRYGLLYSPAWWNWYDAAKPSLFVRVSGDGGEMSRTVVPGVKRSVYGQRVAEEAMERVAITPVFSLVDRIMSDPPRFTFLAAGIPLIVGVASAIGALLILRRGQVTQRSTMVLWSATCLMLGPGGLLLLLASVRFPLRVRCGSCRRRTRADESSCRQCGRPFAEPTPGPVAIFDRPPAVASVPS